MGNRNTHLCDENLGREQSRGAIAPIRKRVCAVTQTKPLPGIAMTSQPRSPLPGFHWTPGESPLAVWRSLRSKLRYGRKIYSLDEISLFSSLLNGTQTQS